MNHPLINAGMIYKPNFISEEQAKWLVENIDSNAWDYSIKRRTQHYGYRYDYTVKVAADNYIGPLPKWLIDVIQWSIGQDWRFPGATQVIVNEYQPGQGIAMHTDHRGQFGPVVASISLLSPVSMCFKGPYGAMETYLTLEPNSLLLLTGEARSKWQHGFNGSAIKARRLSLTFRTML